MRRDVEIDDHRVEREQVADALQRLIDREEIRAAIHGFSRGCDRRDWGLVRAAFHDDAHDDHGSFQGGPDELVAWLSGRHDGGQVEQSMHLLGEIRIDFLQADVAIAETCVRVMQRYSAEAVQARSMFDVDGEIADGERIYVEVAHRYIDRFECREGRWAIARRVVTYEDAQVTKRAAPVFAEGWDVATRDRDDMIWKMLAE